VSLPYGRLILFAQSDTAGHVAERLRRKWIAVEAEKDCLDAGKLRFDNLL